MLPFIRTSAQGDIFVHIFVSKFAKGLQPCKLDAIAAIANLCFRPVLVHLKPRDIPSLPNTYGLTTSNY